MVILKSAAATIDDKRTPARDRDDRIVASRRSWCFCA
jgi:hypothetical protein